MSNLGGGFPTKHIRVHYAATANPLHDHAKQHHPIRSGPYFTPFDLVYTAIMHNS